MHRQWSLQPLHQAQCWWRWSAWRSQMGCADRSGACGSSSGSDPRFWIPHHREFSWWWCAGSGKGRKQHMKHCKTAQQDLFKDDQMMCNYSVLPPCLVNRTTLSFITTYLGWHTDRSLHLQVLLLGPTDQVSADWGYQKKQTDVNTQSSRNCSMIHFKAMAQNSVYSRHGKWVKNVILIAQVHIPFITPDPCQRPYPSPGTWRCGWWGWCGCGGWRPRFQQVPYRCPWKPAMFKKKKVSNFTGLPAIKYGSWILLIYACWNYMQCHQHTLKSAL